MKMKMKLNKFQRKKKRYNIIKLNKTKTKIIRMVNETIQCMKKIKKIMSNNKI